MHCLPRALLIAVVSVLGGGQMIAACGQKGDLYLPEPKKETAKKRAPKAEAKVGDQSQADEGAAPTAGDGQPARK